MVQEIASPHCFFSAQKQDFSSEDPSYAAAHITAILPAYNEERAIARMVPGCKKYMDKVVVVDEGSTTRPRYQRLLHPSWQARPTW